MAQNLLVDGGVIDDGRYVVRMAGSPTCGVRMSALRSAGREQQPSSTSSSKSASSAAIDRRATAALRRDNAAVGLDPRRDVTEPRDTELSHHASTSSTDSICSKHLQRHAPPVVPRRTVSLFTGDKQPNSNCRDSSASQFCRKSEMSRQIILKKSDKITSSRSDCLGQPVSRQSPAADQQTDKVQRRLNGCRSTSVSNVLRIAEHHRRLDNATVEPRRRYFHPWRLSETDVDEFSAAGSMSTITSVNSSLSSSSSGTLTDDADESTDESTTSASRDKRRLDRGHHLCTSDVCSDRLACSAHVAPPSYRAGMASGNKTRISRCTSRESSSSSKLPSSLSATSSSQRPAENYSEVTKQTGNVRMTSRAPVTRSKHITASPSAPPQKCAMPHSAANWPKNRPPSTSESETNVPPSLRRSPSDAKTAAAGHVIHSPPLAAVGRCQQTVIDDSSLVQANSNVVPTPVAVKPPTSPPLFHVQTRLQADAVKKAAPLAGVSNSNSSFNHFPVSLPSKVAFQAPLRRASGIPIVSAASKISSALRDTRRRGTSTGLPTNAVDKGSQNVTNGRELVDKPVDDLTAGVMASRRVVKPPTAAIVKHVKSSKSRTDNSCSRKSARGVSTSTTKTQTSSTAATRLATRDNEKTAVTKRPPPPPQIKRASVPCMTAATDRRRVSVAEQKRPASMDCLAVSSVRQQSADVCCTQSNSSVNVANPSTSIEQAPATKKSAKGVLNKNSQLAKSYDCISPLSNDQEIQNCLETHGSSMSLVDMPLRKLVKPYSVINKCSTFGRRTTPPNVVHSSSKGCNKNIKTENVATGNQSLLASQARASELFDLPEIDEIECDCQMSTASRISTDEADNVRQLQSPVETTTTIISPSICPSTHQNSTEKYRSEYSTFLSAFPRKDCKLIIAKTVQVASSDNSLSHQGCVSVTIKRDENDVVHNCYSTTRLLENCDIQTDDVDNTRLNCYVEPDCKSCIPAARPVTLPAEIPIVEDAATDITVGKYVVTYESDNIVVLDRAPVIDCLTPEGDVVSTEACQQLLTMPADSVSTAPGEGGLSRTFPLSESGYDTWKSSQGSVAVAATCVDFSVEQHQKLEKDGTLSGCDCDFLKAFDALGAQIMSQKNVDTEERETYCPEESSDSLALFEAGDNLLCESVNSAAGASVDTEVKAGDRCGESVSCDDESGRVADCSVEDSALRHAQMFVSICSDVAEQVAGRTSSRTADRADSHDSEPSHSLPDNAVLSLTDPSDICFSLQTIPTDDSDELSTPCNAAHLDRFNKDARDASLLLPCIDHLRHYMNVHEVSGTSDILADVGHDNICLDTAIISTRNTAADFDADKDCVADVKHVDGGRGRVSKLSLTDENTDSTRREPFSTAAVVTAAVSDPVVLDSYETICDDLLESMEDNVSDSEQTHLSFLTRQPAEPCPTTLHKSSEDSEKLKSADDHDIVAVSSSGAEWQSTHSGLSTVNSNSPPSTVTSGRLPVMTSRHVRTNFSVISRQTALQPKASQSRQSSAQVKTKASSHEATSDKPSGTVGCRRALAVLASRLDEHGRRRIVETNGDERAASKFSLQPVTVDHDSGTPNIRPAQSSMTVDVVPPTRAESKLPVSTASTRCSVPKKPLTFRKLLSSKLTSVVRRTQTKSDVNK